MPHSTERTAKTVSGQQSDLGLSRRRYDAFHPALELRAWQHDLPVTAETANTDVRADPDDTPGIATTRVDFPHLDDISHAQRHRGGHTPFSLSLLPAGFSPVP